MHKDPVEISYSIADTFMLRVPLLTANVLRQISRAEDTGNLLRKYYGNPIIGKALFLASPDLYSAAMDWLSDRGSYKGDHEKLKNALMKYLIRMSSRCTPFGMFAGICTGSFDNLTRLEIGAPGEHDLHVRPDMQLLCSLASAMQKIPVIRNLLNFTGNSSLYRIGDEYRYIEYFTDGDGLRTYRLQSSPCTAELTEVVEKAKTPVKLKLLTDAISKNGITKSAAEEYLNLLIDNQILVSELEPPVSGIDFSEKLLDTAKLINDNEYVRLAEKIVSGLRDAGSGNPQMHIDHFISTAAQIDELGIPFSRANMLQADMQIKCRHCTLSHDIQDDLIRFIPLLMRLSSPPRNMLLSRFRDNFLRRYDGAEVPLNIALDAEAGIGYLPDDVSANASALLHGLKLTPGGDPMFTVDWTDVDRMLLRKMQLALMTGKETIRLQDEDLLSLPEPGHNFPLSFSVMARIGGMKDEGGEKPLIQLVSCGGVSAANLAGRFCTYDDSLCSSVRKINGIEQSIMGDVILAEIVHLPQQRTGNILMRPVMRPYEIPFLASPGVAHEYCIPLADLLVSVRRNKIMLRSEKLNRHIVPRMSNAHNFSAGSLAVYRFLCDLQSQEMATAMGFSWGAIENDAVFLPRVTFRNFILHPATWNLSRSETNIFTKATNDRLRIMAIDQLRSYYHVPRYVALSQYDNELWLDLQNAACLSLLQAELKSGRPLRLQEYQFDPGHLWVKGRDGGHTNEFVFFFHQTLPG